MIKRTLVLLPLFFLVSVLHLAAWSLPKSMIMTTEMTAKNGNQNVKVNAKMWYSGMKFRTEINSNIKMQNTQGPAANKAVVIVDMNSRVGYMLNEATKVALKVDSAQLNQMSGGTSSASSFTDPAMISNPEKLKAEIKSQGGKVVGQQALLGHKCTIWQLTSKKPVQTSSGGPKETVTFKLWLADDIAVPLKVEVISPSRGKIATLDTKSLQINVPVSATLFQVPAGYKVTNMSEMFQSQGKPKPNR